MKTTNKKYFGICMFVILCLFIFFSFHKKGTFVDELLTYDLSNRQSAQVEYMKNYLKDSSFGQIADDISDLLHNGKSNSRIYQDFQVIEAQNAETSVWHDSRYFSDFITVEEGSRFDFLSVMYNSVYDSAPPFYYYLIHFVCSLFPGTFSLWYGLVVNILFLILTCGLLYRLTEKYFGGTKYAILVCLCYALSIGGLSTLLIIRMYAVYTFFVTAFFFINLHIAENGFTFTRKSRICYIICAVLGFYTQYYFVIYAGLLIGTITAFLMMRKATRTKITPYLTTSLTAAFISLILWPFSIKHIFFDSFGAGTLENAASGDFFYKIKEYILVLIKNLFADNFFLFFGLCALCVGGIAIFAYRAKRQGKLHNPSLPSTTENIPAFSFLKSGMLFLPIAGYFILVAVSAPFISERYIMCIFPLLMMGIFFLLKNILSIKVGKYTFPALCLAGICVTILGLTNVEWNYTYKDRTERAALMTEAEDTICIYVSADNGWQYKSVLDIMAACKKTAIIYPEQTAELALECPSPEEYSRVLICISSAFDQQQILEDIIASCGFQDKTVTPLSAVNDEYAAMYLLE